MDSSAATGASAAVSVFGCIITLAMLAFSIVVGWRIFSKAGYSGAMSLLLLVPIGNLIVICILAFGRWPIYEELDRLRQMASGAAYPPQQPGYPQQPGMPPQPGYPPQQPGYPPYR
ncbi:MAG TPA: hypothetical protein VKR06_35145 [Ktedonosporobacter sp.]|nr:hypothetical protein [Ktedonosporobacter sp.]